MRNSVCQRCCEGECADRTRRQRVHMNKYQWGVVRAGVPYEGGFGSGKKNLAENAEQNEKH